MGTTLSIIVGKVFTKMLFLKAVNLNWYSSNDEENANPNFLHYTTGSSLKEWPIAIAFRDYRS